ncbi:MAG: CBU_0592 family membrane protein [Pyrinomonadaceae bacterium]
MRFGLPDVVGAIGVVMLMLAYLLLQIGKLESKSLVYSVLNALGASLIVISLVFDFNLAAFVIEIFWIAISLIGIYRTLRARTDSP